MGVDVRTKGGFVRKIALSSLAFVTAVSLVPTTQTVRAYADEPTAMVETTTSARIASSSVALDVATTEISTADQFVAFANAVTAGTDYSGVAVKLTADIDLSSITGFAGIGTKANRFNGTFDGQGYAITGISITSANDVVGLFAATGKNAIIQNLTISGSVTSTATSNTTIAQIDGIGALVGVNRGTISHVTSSMNVTADNMCNVGALVGWNSGAVNQWSNASRATQVLTDEVNNGAITACVTTGNAEGDCAVGGIAGHNSGSIESCLAFGKIDGLNTSSKNGVGGIVGRNGNNNTAYETGTINACAFYGTVGRSGQKWVGGITGFCSGTYGNASCTPSTVTNCYMAGTLATNGTGYDNQIVGNLEGTSTNNYAISTSGNTGSTAGEIGIKTTLDALKTQTMASNLSVGTRWVFAAETDAIATTLADAGFAGVTVPVALTSNAATVTETVKTGAPVTSYSEGQYFDAGDLAITNTYSDGTMMQAPFTSSKPGPYTIDDNGTTMTISGEGFSYDYTLEVTSNEVSSIALYSTSSSYSPTVTVYSPGESIDLTGLKLKVSYTNGTTETITFTSELPEGWATNFADPLTLDENGKTLALSYTYNGKTTTYDTSSVSGKGVTIAVMNAPATDEQGYYQLTSPEDLYWFAAQVNQHSATVNGILANDIDLSGVTYMPIGSSESAMFNGVLDGNGKTITYSDTTTFTMTTNYNGVVGYLGAGTVKNLTTAGSVKLNSNSGAIAGYINGAGTISNCTNNADITNAASNSASIGGIVGSVAASSAVATVENCTNNGSVTTVYSNVGGIAGSAGATNGIISSCTNNGAVAGSMNIGGIYGYGKAAVDNCLNTGTVTGSSATSPVGGIVGSDTSTSLTSGNVTNSGNTGALTGSKVGGIVGSTYKAAYENCYNTGDITSIATSSAYGSGGLCGTYNSNNAGATFTNCYNAGAITRTSSGTIAALIGYDTKGAVLTNCYFVGDESTAVWGGSAAETTGYIAKTSDEMKSVDTVTALNGESGTAWTTDTGATQVNNGYPILSWQYVSPFTVTATCSAADKGMKGTVTTTITGADSAVYRFYYSADGGETWTLSGKNKTGVYDVTANVTNSKRDWKVVATADGRTAEAAFDVTFTDPTASAEVTPAAKYGAKATVKVTADHTGIYTAAKYSFYYSADQGVTWTKVGRNLTGELQITANSTNCNKRIWKAVVLTSDDRTCECPFTLSYTK